MHSKRAELPRRWLFAGAAAFAGAELAAGLLIGGFFAWGRAEALLFFAFRPWLLLAGAVLVARFGWRSRTAFYALSLGGAGLSESSLLLAVGGDPWGEMVRGWAAGGAVAVAFDLIVQLGRRLSGRFGIWAAAALGLAMLIAPGTMSPYDALALGPTGPQTVSRKSPLMLMTGLPIIWGETGPFDSESRPAASYRALKQEYAVRALDYLDRRSLVEGRLMLLAQPRALEPAELVALDEWVRNGGRLLVLADPVLLWPSPLPHGDFKRPPSTSYLAPLFRHWGLRLVEPAAAEVVVEAVRDGRYVRRLVLAAPGRFEAIGDSCRALWRGYLAKCRIGNGQALLLSDADLLHDRLWTAPVARGDERHARIADNPLIVAGLLDRLGGVERERAARPVQWRSERQDGRQAVIFALLPILALAAMAFRARRPAPTH